MHPRRPCRQVSGVLIKLRSPLPIYRKFPSVEFFLLRLTIYLLMSDVYQSNLFVGSSRSFVSQYLITYLHNNAIRCYTTHNATAYLNNATAWMLDRWPSVYEVVDDEPVNINSHIQAGHEPTWIWPCFNAPQKLCIHEDSSKSEAMLDEQSHAQVAQLMLMKGSSLIGRARCGKYANHFNAPLANLSKAATSMYCIKFLYMGRRLCNVVRTPDTCRHGLLGCMVFRTFPVTTAWCKHPGIFRNGCTTHQI